MRGKRAKGSDKTSEVLKYEGLDLPVTLNYILEQDFWMLENIPGSTLALLHAPVKFASTTSIFVRKGSCRAEINLEKYDIEAPCVVNVASSEIMVPLSISEDFEGAFVVMSPRLVGDIKAGVPDQELLNSLRTSPILKVSPHQVAEFDLFYSHLRTASSDNSNPYIYQGVLHSILSFLFTTATKCVRKEIDHKSTAAHITSRFLKLARENFKKERFMDFYANAMGITPKHLGRTIKAQTGFTASEWLDRLIILEAKVLLKSTSMTVQQIAEDLNFPSQSFFGKYFKNIVGVSPKEFRNS